MDTLCISFGEAFKVVILQLGADSVVCMAVVVVMVVERGWVATALGDRGPVLDSGPL